MTFWQRISTDTRNAANDVYSHWILGDDAGKSALTTFIYRLNHSNNHNNTDNTDTIMNELGMTYIEINGRAYIKSVLPNSVAYRAGVLPQDAIQLAIPIRQQWEKDADAIILQQQQQKTTRRTTDDDDDDDDNVPDETTATSRIEHINRMAQSYGLKLEKKGSRTSYNQLLRLLSKHVYHTTSSTKNTTGTNTATTQQWFLSPPVTETVTTTTNPKKTVAAFSMFTTPSSFSCGHNNNNNSNTTTLSRAGTGTTTIVGTQRLLPWDEPPTPSKLCGTMIVQCNDDTSSSNHNHNNNHMTHPNDHHEMNDNNHTMEFQNSYLNFDRPRSVSSTDEHSDNDIMMNDNNDTLYVHNNHQHDKLAVSSSSPSPPNAILFILRRTRQRRVVQETVSCFVPASFRFDDECDLACTLVRRLAPTADMEAPIPDTWEELVHDGTDWLLGHTSMLPPKNGIPTTTATTTITTTPSDAYYAGSSINNDYNTTSAAAAAAAAAPGMMSIPSNTTTVHGGGTTATTTSIPMDNNNNNNDSHHHSNNNSIPLDAFEQIRTKKLASLRSRITAETMLTDRTDDVEAATVRAMIQKAVGLAFVRASKIVLGVSIHGGSGIVIARLPDGTWSAPSAIGTWGLGLGVQFGLEVAEYIFILQTPEAMQHFKRGGSYTVGGNMGIAIGGLGREAYGAASVGGGGCNTDTTTTSTTTFDEEYNDENSRDGYRTRDHSNRAQSQPPPPSNSSFGIAPIVAYAKSQGLYIGVSLEGSRIFTRNDINCRTYKFSSGRNVTADDILSGKVPTPPEAEELYAALHSVEFTHEMSRLPRPPEILRNDSANAWIYDRSMSNANALNDTKSHDPYVPRRQQHPLSFLNELSTREADECTTFEAQFKNFLYGGVSVQRLIIDSDGGSDRTGKERRTLWLMLPEIGSLRIGFVSKLSDGEGVVSNKSSTQRARRDDSNRNVYEGDNCTVGSEELTLDSALITKDGSTTGPIHQGNVQLSESHSVALTDVTMLSQDPAVQIKFKGEDKTQHLRVISLQDVSGTNLLFLANNFREAELLVCGLKLLLERETARLGVRGGLPVSALGGTKSDGAMSPAAARGFREIPSTAAQSRSPNVSSKKPKDAVVRSRQAIIEKAADRKLNVGNWGKQPGRDYMRGQASSALESTDTELQLEDIPVYVHGQAVVKSIAKHIRIPLPIPLCRVLLLDSTSPVITQWQKDRGDGNFEHSQWLFPPSTPRELEHHASEHQLIASGSMCGAERTASFDRPRYGSLVRLMETFTVDIDDPQKLSLYITESSPRRGFAMKVRILLRATKDNLCEATAFADIRPVGKDMSNQSAVQKAYLLVLDEAKLRYGTAQNGLLASFLSVVDEMANSLEKPNTVALGVSHPRSMYRTDSNVEEKKSDFQSTGSVGTKSSGLVSLEDMLKTGRESPDVVAAPRPETPGLTQQIPEVNPAKRIASRLLPISDAGEFVAADTPETSTKGAKNDSVLIEVKPLPKIRLALMPSPREEDEETSSSKSPFQPKPIKKKKKKTSSSKSESKRSSTRLSTSDLKRHIS